MTLTTLENPVEWVLAHPERYFKTGAANDLELAQSVWLDATLSGASDVIVHREAAVWVIAGSANWLADSKAASPDLFVRIVALPAAGPNSMRSEILLNAFCTEVVAVAAGASVFQKGSGPVQAALDSVLQRWTGLDTAVGFRL